MKDDDPQWSVRSPLSRHPAYAQALGMVSIEIGTLEHSFGQLLSVLLTIKDEVGLVVYFTPASSRARLQIVRNVAKTIFEPKNAALVEILKLIKDADAALDARNDLIHAVWSVDDEDRGKVSRLDAPMFDAEKLKPTPLSQVENLVGRVRRLHAELLAYKARIEPVMRRASLNTPQ